MTLAEKLGQLTMTAGTHALTGPVLAGDSSEAVRAGAVGNVLNIYGAEAVHALQRIAVGESRLGIPLLFGLDVVHGHRTLFPVPLAEAGVFDPALWERSAREAACEAAADGIAMTFAPMLDVARDPRWGRMVEGPGEDPWLAVRYAQAKVRGFQGSDLAAPACVAAVAKHYCAYGAVSGGRDYASVELSEHGLRETYLPPFAAAVRAGVAAVMPAFTDLGGMPSTADPWLLQDVLRGELGFEGVVVSDYNAIGELIAHGVARDLPEAAAIALRAGVDIDMIAGAYRRGLPVALERGLVDIAAVDAAVRRVLQLKQRLGLFDAPFARGASAEPAAAVASRRRLARELAARTLVLLTQQPGSLPLPATLRRLALVGPLADAPGEMRGPWWAAGQPADCVPVLAGLEAALPATQIRYAAGVPLTAPDHSGIGAALEACAEAEAIVLCLGEPAGMSGEAASRAHLGLPGAQRELAERVLLAAGGVRPVIVVLFCGRPLVLPWLFERASAVIAAWFPGCEAGHAVADVLTGRAVPCGRSVVSWPRAEGQIPVFFGQRPGGRPARADDVYTSKYLDVPNEPLFAFGCGAGYSACTLRDFALSADAVPAGQPVEASVEVVNEGDAALEHTVYAFVRHPLARRARPLLELAGIAHVSLPGRARTRVRIGIPWEQLAPPPAFLAGGQCRQVEICIGSSAAAGELLRARVPILT